MSYTPKPGDSVKATLGDSVVYGTVDEVFGDDDIGVLVDGSVYPRVFEASIWTFEPWVKPVTFKPLTVLKLATDAASVVDPEWEASWEWDKPLFVYRTNGGDWYSDPSYEVDGWQDASMQKALAYGKAEVLFEGVEE